MLTILYLDDEDVEKYEQEHFACMNKQSERETKLRGFKPIFVRKTSPPRTLVDNRRRAYSSLPIILTEERKETTNDYPIELSIQRPYWPHIHNPLVFCSFV